MDAKQETVSEPTLGKTAATQGIKFGIVITVMTLSAMLSIDVASLSILCMAIFLFVPFMLYRAMTDYKRQRSAEVRHSELWMLGIGIFFFGSLICAIATYIFLRFVQPDYLYRMITAAIAAVEQTPSDQQESTLKVLHGIIDNGMLPTAIEVAVQLIWSYTFSGSILSLIVAAIAKGKSSTPTNQPRQ